MPDYISIGKFVATHGLKGDLVLKHMLGKKTALQGVKALFIQEVGASYMPWFIEKATSKNQEEIFIKLEGIATPEAARKLNQKTVWLRKEDFEKQASTAASIYLIGFAVINDGVLLGSVTSVIEQPHQILCTIIMNGKEVFIPLHEQTLQRIDKNQKQIHVILPEGLLEIYLNE